jgi:hypothetical protein
MKRGVEAVVGAKSKSEARASARSREWKRILHGHTCDGIWRRGKWRATANSSGPSLNGAGHAVWWRRPYEWVWAQFKLFPNKFQTLPNFEIQNRRFSCFRNNQICMIQDLNILNNFLHWPNFKFPIEIMF